MSKEYLPIFQIVVSIFLILAIILQKRGAALGSVFGGGSEFYFTKRGLERKLFLATIFLGILFIALSLLNLIL